MQKVGIIAHSSLREDLITMLHDEGVIDVRAAAQKLQVDHTEVEYKEAEVAFAATVLKDFADKQTLAVCDKKVAVEETVHAAKHTDVKGIVTALHQLEKEDTESTRRIQELADLREELAHWKNLNANLQESNESENTIRIFGTLPSKNEKILHDSMTQSTKRSVLEKVSQTPDGDTAFVAIIWKEDLRTFEEIATGLGWTNSALPNVNATPGQSYEEAIMEEKKLTEALSRNALKRKKLSVELPNLLKVQLFMHWLDQKQEVRESMASTESTITLLGWMSASRMQELEKKLEKLNPAIALIKVKPDEGEETPVLLKNNKLVAPFESVTGLYGLPLSHEMDPTAALSPFFILYFSLCLTDAGYGAIIAIIFGSYLLKTRKSIQEAKLPWLLFFGGIMTFLVSIPFGGWFGLTPEQLPAMFSRQTAEGLMFKGQIWNLGKQSGIDFLQNLSLALGVTHLFFGMFLAGQHKWIHGKKAEALWVDFTAHLLLGSIIFLVVAPEGLGDIAKYVLYGSIAIMIWGKGYGSKWYVRPLMGLIGTMNFVIGMISNGLSYLRILALGLVTGAIAAAINQVAVEMGKLFPIWLAIPVIVIIFLGGHTVSIALNTLGSFIHSGRLQFIEFFSQFFEGGGKEFSPFRRSTSS
ncbi:MAG: V-type ATPase 116kDa subunit family protein [Candidatus Peribacteraceae bacterium]|nr:V-type ATPase 116kDa subunit family protein [Candidatus Peribacteraceae bacterium]